MVWVCVQKHLLIILHYAVCRTAAAERCFQSSAVLSYGTAAAERGEFQLCRSFLKSMARLVLVATEFHG